MNSKKSMQCEFCGTTDKKHNIQTRHFNKGEEVFSLVLCDNPVCNAVPGSNMGTRIREGKRPSL